MSGTPNSDLRLAQWKEFVKQFLLHVTDNAGRIQDGPNAGALPIDFIRAIEIWNEPNLPRFWGYRGGSADVRAAEYARVYRQAKAGIDELGGLPKSTRLISGGLVADQQSDSYLRTFLNALGPGTYPDGVGVHLYATRQTDPDAAITNFREDYRRIGDVLEDPSLNLPDMPRWITEFGYPEDPGEPPAAGEPPLPRSEENQTDVLTSMYRWFLDREGNRPRTDRPASVLLYRLVDGQAVDDGADKHAFGTTAKTGAQEGSYRPKESFCALPEIGRKNADCRSDEVPQPLREGTGPVPDLSTPPQQGRNVFEGECTVDGRVTYTVDTERSGLLRNIDHWTLAAVASGNCTGNLNGRAVSGEPVSLELARNWDCDSIWPTFENGSSGPGALVFSNRTPGDPADDTTIDLGYSIPNARVDGQDEYLLELSGLVGGEAVGTMALAPKGWGGCSPDDADLRAAFRTITPLTDDA